MKKISSTLTSTWEYAGIVPDVMLPIRWDLFTEADDPGLAKGVELLMKKYGRA